MSNIMLYFLREYMASQKIGGMTGDGVNTGGYGGQGGYGGMDGKKDMQGEMEWDMKQWEKKMKSGRGLMEGSNWTMDEDAIMMAIWAGVVMYWVFVGLRVFYTVVLMKWFKEGKWL